MSHPADAFASRSITRWLAFLAASLVAIAMPGAAAAADLNATPSNLSSVYSSAQGGDVIHLAAGSYGSFAGGSKSSVVTLVAASGATATISPSLGSGVNNLRFDGLTIDGVYTNGARNVAFVNSRFTGLVRVDTPANVSNANIVFDRDTFDGLSATATSYEGRLTVRGYDNGSPVGVAITNSHFGNGGCSDGVQIIGNAYGVQVGPGNEFSAIKQGSCTAHVDSIQLYGSSHSQIVGNYFHDDDTIIMAPDGGDSEVIANNVMVGSGYAPAVQLGSHDGTQFVHNTVKNFDVYMDAKSGASPSTNGVLRDNVVVNGSLNAPSTKCSSCTISYNLFNQNATGSNAITATPQFPGGASPTTYQGYALAAGSPGKANASDGTDRGINTTTTAPPADTTAPDATITSGPTGTTNDSTPTFAFTATEANSVFECRVDSGSWADCTSPWTTSALSDGAHSVSVRATDVAGNTDASPATRSFTVATAPASDTTAPDTTITSGPSGTTDDATPTFAFSASEASSVFECQVDAGAWASCTSPWTTSELSEGAHSVSVRATDVAGNTDASPATRSITVATAAPADTTAPETTITSGPSATTSSTSASFAFDASESGSTFECKLDAGAYADCTSPKDYSNLSAGSHTFSVRASDAAGNTDATPATRTWTVQDAPPVDHQPAAAFAYGPASPTIGQAVTFDASSATCADTPCTYTWEDDGPDGTGGTQWPLGEGKTMTFTFQGEGVKYVRLSITDADGDTDSTMKPITVAASPAPDPTAPDTTITSGPSDTTSSTTPTFAFASSEEASAFECRLDSGAWLDCTSPWTTTELGEGPHTVSVRATDAAGNTDASPATRTFTVTSAPASDITPPDTTIASGPDGPTNDTTPTFVLAASEPGSVFACQIDFGAAQTCESPWTTSVLADGQHRVAVSATDAAGNRDATPATRSFSVDTQAPDTTIASAPPDVTSSTSATLTFAADESSVTFQCRLDWRDWVDCTSPKTYTGLTVARHWFAVRATDAAGNVEAYPARARWSTVAG